MKLKIYTLILALGAAWSLQSCDNNDDDSIAVPAELQNAFSSKYPNAANVKWESKSGYYVADFYDGYEASAWFTQDGKWQMTETDIPYDALPQAVKTSFEATECNTSWRIDDVDKLERESVETVYVIEVEKQNQELDLYYSEEGVLIKSVVDTDDDRDDQYLPDQNAKLTVEMRNFLDTKYPGFKLIEVDVEDEGKYVGYTEVDIIHERFGKEVLFNKSGEWALTSWEVHFSMLPEPVKSTINTAYPGQVDDDDAEYVEEATGDTYYLIDIENSEKDVKISADGQILG